MKAMNEEPKIEGTCPTCGRGEPKKPTCPLCQRVIADWPDNPEVFLTSRGWRKEDGRWHQPKERLRLEQVIHKEGEKLVDGRLQPVYVTLQPDQDRAFSTVDAIEHDLRPGRGSMDPVVFSKPVFSEKEMAEILAEHRGNSDTELTRQLEVLKKSKQNINVSPCSVCGQWPDGFDRKKASKRSLDHPPVEPTRHGLIETGVPAQPKSSKARRPSTMFAVED